MKAFISHRQPDGGATCARVAELVAETNPVAAERELRVVLDVAEPAGGTQGVRNRHYTLDSLGYAGRNLAEALAGFIALDLSELS